MHIERYKKRLKAAISSNSAKQITSKRLKEFHKYFSHNNSQYSTSSIRSINCSFRLSRTSTEAEENDANSSFLETAELSLVNADGERHITSTENKRARKLARSNTLATDDTHSSQNTCPIPTTPKPAIKNKDVDHQETKKFFESHFEKIISDCDDIPLDIKLLLLKNLSQGYYHMTYSLNHNSNINDDDKPTPVNYYHSTKKRFYLLYEFVSINHEFSLKATTIIDYISPYYFSL